MKSLFKKFFISLLFLAVLQCNILQNRIPESKTIEKKTNPTLQETVTIPTEAVVMNNNSDVEDEKKTIPVFSEPESINNKGKSSIINIPIVRNKFEKIFEQTLGEELNSEKIEIIGGDNCEPLKTNEKCLSVNPEQRSGQFDKYYFYLNGENNVYAITAFYNSRFGSQAECRTFIKEWENYFNKFIFKKISNKKNQDQFVMVDGVEGEVTEVSMSCFNEKIRDINSTVSLNIVKKF